MIAFIQLTYAGSPALFAVHQIAAVTAGNGGTARLHMAGHDQTQYFTVRESYDEVRARLHDRLGDLSGITCHGS